MKRVFAGAMSAVLLALLGCACDDSSSAGYGYGPGANPQCGQFATCGACTPAIGCGWCTTAGVSGLCVQDPGDCPRATTIAFSWEPSGCHGVSSDASILADASVREDAKATDAADAADVADE